jgi:hypothetical protein
MIDRTWYACRLKEDLIHFRAGATLYIRKGNLTTPLHGGPFFILFRTYNPVSVRFFESLGLHSTVDLLPNRITPKPANEETNLKIEKAYREYLKTRPVLLRHPEKELKRRAIERQERAVSLLQQSA